MKYKTIKMKGEIPVFTRCCFCVPLRYGLLAWGYFKMAADALLVFIMTYSVIDTVMMLGIFKSEERISWLYTELILSMITIIVFFTDFVVTIVFIVGGHKKNAKLIRVFYFFSIGLCVVTLLLSIFSFITTMQSLLMYSNIRYWGYALVQYSFYFVIIVVQSYILLLLRSEVIKLRNVGEFQFVNIAAEAECTMKIETVGAGEETKKEDV